MNASTRRPHRRSRVLVVAAVFGATALSLVGFDAAPVSAAGGGKKARLRENSYYYGAFNRRDPFRSLVDGSFVRDGKMELVSLGAVELVGVVRGDLDRFALLEDEKGFTYILRVGDRVRNGSIVAVGENTLTARVTSFGQTRKVTLHMVERQKGEKR